MMNNKNSPTKAQRTAAALWLGFCLFLLGSCLFLLPGAHINSSVLALLPKQTMGSIPPTLSDGFMQRLDRQLVWMVSPGYQEDSRAAEAWFSLLQTDPHLKNLRGPMAPAYQQAWGEFSYRYRNGNLDEQTRARLQKGGEQQAQWITAQIYSAFSGVSGKEIQHDPMMLVRGAQLAMTQNASQLQLRQGWLVSQDKQGRYWYLLHGELNGSSFDMQQIRNSVEHLQALERNFQTHYPEAKILSRGTLFYSDHASQQARKDASTLGIATLIGVLCLIVGAFRSLRPLFLCLLSIGIGALAGSVTVLLLYGELHLITLVMSMSIVGISADYTLYYLTERMVHGQEMSPWKSLHKVRSALLLALFTTVAAYLLLMLAPFPGIRQLALFAASGLTASCLTVLCWYPWLSRGLPVRPVPALPLMLRWLAAWRRKKSVYLGVPLLMTLLAIVGLSRLHIDDDISQLQSLPASILAQEKQITALTGQGVDQKWFIVFGATAQETLQRLEQFEPSLAKARQQGLISHYRRIPLNSMARQQQDLLLIQAAAPAVSNALQRVGFKNLSIDTQPAYITPEQWLNAPVSEGWRLLWMTLQDGSSGVLIPVTGVEDSQALAELAQTDKGVVWVDRKATFDQLFSLYRSLFSGLLIIALMLIGLGTFIRLGWRKGVISLVPSVLSLACGLASLAVVGYPITLFALLALALVLGIGINYTLFFSNPRGTPVTSLLAITLAMLTTLMTLGMLVFSQTQAISSFGIVLCSGIFSAFLLSPLAMPGKQGRMKS